MSMGNDGYVIMDWLHRWWPAMAFLAVAYFGFLYITGNRRGAISKLDSVSLPLHEIQASLGCSEAQAKRLLAVYGGNSTKAIHEIKTGKAVMPGQEVSDLALFGGEFSSFTPGDGSLSITTGDGGQAQVSTAEPGFLFLGVADPEQRPDSLGNARADRGPTYGQLFLKKDGQWLRFLMNARRMDYTALAERKQNTAIRNFRTVLEDLLQALPHLQKDLGVDRFLGELRAPHFKSLADLEASATQILPNPEGDS